MGLTHALFPCKLGNMFRILKILQKALVPFRLAAEVLILILKSVLHFFIFRILRPVFLPRGRNRVRLVLLVAIFLTVFFATLNYPVYWNTFADWVNPKFDAVNVPTFIEKYDNWGIFRTLDEKIYIKHFWDVPFSLGLDLQGGTHLVYEADTRELAGVRVGEAMAGLRDVIE